MLKVTKQMYIAVAVIVSVIGVIGYNFFQPKPTTNMNVMGLEEEKEVETEGEEGIVELYVDIKGGVMKEGVYCFKEGERVKDAVERAGGFVEGVEKKAVNLAQLLEDEMVLYIPLIGEEEDVVGVVGEEKDGKININKADNIQLQTIPGIGPAKAADILAYREQNGPFKTIEDLQEVNGIGEKTLEKLRTYIVVK